MPGAQRWAVARWYCTPPQLCTAIFPCLHKVFPSPTTGDLQRGQRADPFHARVRAREGGYARPRMTQLADIMRRDVLGVAPEDTLGFAAEQMAERDVGAVVVLDYGRLIGILSERDILRAVAGRVHSSEARVREWMTADPKTATPQASPEEAARVMVENGFRHLPVVEDDQAVGIVSIRDVMRWTVQAGPAEAGSST